MKRKENKVIPLKLLFDHFRLRKPQEGLEKGTPPPSTGRHKRFTIIFILHENFALIALNINAPVNFRVYNLIQLRCLSSCTSM